MIEARVKLASEVYSQIHSGPVTPKMPVGSSEPKFDTRKPYEKMLARRNGEAPPMVIDLSVNEFDSSRDFDLNLSVSLCSGESALQMIKDWHERGIAIGTAHARCEYEMASLLANMHASDGYLHYKSPSLKDYVINFYRLNEYAARDLVTVAVKAVQYPELLEALRTRQSSISKLRKICSMLGEDRKDALGWIKLACEETARTIERCVAMAKPQTAKTERATYKDGNVVNLSIDISQELFLELNLIQDYLCQRHQGHVTREKVLEFMKELALDKLDPVRKAERAQARKNRKKKPDESADHESAETAVNKTKTDSAAAIGTPIELETKQVDHEPQNQSDRIEPVDRVHDSVRNHEPSGATCHQVSVSPAATKNARKRDRIFKAQTRHELNLRDKRQCSYINERGERCPNRRYLQTHHHIRIADGGSNELENLTTLCSGHHKLHHFEEARMQ